MILAGRHKFRNISFLVSFVQLTFLMLFERNDPDPFHSGFVYSQSLAVSNGLLPNKNFLSPYGVIGPLANGLWLHVVNDSLLSLLFLYGLILIASGYLMSNEISRLSNPILGYLLSTVWIFSFGTAMPWPSILCTFLTLLSIKYLLRNREAAFRDTTSKHLYLFLVVACLDLAILTRIHLAITPLTISVFVIIKRKSLSASFVKMWFYFQVAIGGTFVLVLQFLGVLRPFIDQAIVWPLTAFENPPVNASFLFSFVWFPVALSVMSLMALLIKLVSRISTNKMMLIFPFLLCLAGFYVLYFFSSYEFSGSDVTTVKTMPGFIKTASLNMQFVIGYAAGAAACFGLLALLQIKRNRAKWAVNNEKQFEFCLMISLTITGLIQLYPLHDNVHLWFVTPLLLLPAVYYLITVIPNFQNFFKPLSMVLISILLIQLLSLWSFLAVPRVPLESQELKGMMASVQYKDTVDQSMKLLDRYVSKRKLRNNCPAGLFSVAGKKYQSIDGNFSGNFFENFVKSVPIVDASSESPDLIFECGISQHELVNIEANARKVLFALQLKDLHGKPSPFFNILYEVKK